MELWLLPEKKTSFADVDLGLNRVREDAAFPQLRTSVQACGHSREGLCMPSSVHGECKTSWLLTFL